MKAKINYKSKKTIIIIAIAAVLLIAAVIGTVAFIKGNNDAAAAMVDESTTAGEEQGNNGGTDDQNGGNPNENPQTGLPDGELGDGTTTENEGTVVDGNGNAGATGNQGATGNAGNNAATGNGGTTGTTTGRPGTGNVPNQDYTQTTTIVIENPWETRQIGWNPLSISAFTAVADLGINRPNLSAEKLAYVQGDLLEGTPVNTAIQKGEIITYVIKVANKGALDARAIRTIDAIPEGTELVENSITENGTLENGKITWKTDIKAGETAELSFQVKVVADEITLIENTAKVNGGNTNITENPVITSAKQANVLVDGELLDRDVKVGETIRYTITVTNKSEVDGITTVTDKVPEGTTYVTGSASAGAEVSEDGTITWNDVAVLANGEVKVSFDVTVNKDRTESVKNIAIVGDTETEETETKVANITTTKSSEGSATPLHELDTITYKLSATNNGNGTGTVNISDEMSAEDVTPVVDENGKAVNLIKVNADGTKTVISSYTMAELKDGIDVELEAGENKYLEFTVTINPFETETKTIKNEQAEQDGTPIPGTTDEVEKSYVEVTVNKTWVDNDVQAQRRPNKIKFELYADGKCIDEYDMSTDEDTASYTFEKLSKYNSDEELIEYTIQEKEINVGDLKFYDSSKAENDPTIDAEGNKTYHFTNTFTRPTDTTQITVNKEWIDNNNSADKRPDSVKLHLNDEEIELNITYASKDNGNIWSTTLLKPVYNENGEEIVYTLDEKEENKPQWYEKTVEGYTVKNTFVAPTDEKYDITITKVWDDNENEAGKRPTEILLQLNKKDVNGNTVAVQDTPIKLTGSLDAEKWTTTVNVQKYDEKANLIKYFVVETETGSPFYVKESEAELTVTNKFEVPNENADIIIRKVWNDKNNTLKRTKVTFAITGNGTTTKVNLTSADANLEDGNIWEKEVTTLPKYDTLGNEITYTFDELNVPEGYIKEVNGNEITNSLPGIKVTKTVAKVNDQDMEGINQITVKEDDIIEYTITVENLGTVDLTNFRVTDNLNVYLNKENPENTTNILEENGTLFVGIPKTYTVYYKVTANDIKVAGQTLKNVATATGDYADSSDNNKTITDNDDADVTIADLPGVRILKTQTVNGKPVTNNTKVKPGDVINYTITVTNTGNTVLKDVNVTDSMTGKEGFTITSGSLNIGTLGIAPNDTAVITAVYTVQESDMKETESIIANTATVTTSTTPDESSEVEVPTEEWKAEIDVVKSSELIKKAGNTITGKAEYGDTIRYTITATNTGKKAGSIDVTDTVPTGTILKETNNHTNLTAKELAQLNTEKGLTKTLEVAGNGTTSIYFEVIVTAKPGESIVNTATLPDGTEKPDGGQDVEKKVNVITKTETPTIKNSNVVIVLDTSESMNTEKSTYEGETMKRIEVAKKVVNKFIDQIKLQEDGKGSAISLVTFNKSASTVQVTGDDRRNTTIINSPTEATSLKEKVNGLSTAIYTVMSGALTEAEKQVNALKTANPDNNNIVIFIGDGKPQGPTGSGENDGKISTAAQNLIKTGATIYSIGFDVNIDILKNTIASSPDKYYTTSANVDLSSIFTQIGSDIISSTPVGTVSNEGLISLDNIDTSKKVTLRVKSSTATKFTVTEDLVENISQIILKDEKYYLDLSKFNADDTIEIDYFVVEE